MKRRFALIVLTLGLIVPGLAALASPPAPALQIDAKGSQFQVFVWKRGLASAFAHDHIMGANDFKGVVEFDRAKPSQSKVYLRIPAAKLQEQKSKMSAEDVKTVKKHMDEDVLEVSKFPSIIFRSSKVVVVKTVKATASEPGNLQLKVTGELDLHGQKHEKTLDVMLVEKAGQLTVTGECKLRQTEYGITPFSAFLGAVGVKDVVDLKFRILTKSRK